MSLLIFKMDKDLRVKNYLDRIIDNSMNLPRVVPLRPTIRISSVPSGKMLVFLNMNIGLPKEFPLIGGVMVGLAWVLTGTFWSWWVLPGIIFLGTRYFWSQRFWKKLFLRGLKNHCSDNSSINWLSAEEALSEVMD